MSRDDVHADGGPVVESNQYSLAFRVGLKMGRRYCRKRVLGRAAHHHFPRPGELSTDLDKPTNPTDDPKGTLHITEPVDISASASIAPSRRPCDHTARPAPGPATYRHTRYQRSSQLHTFSARTPSAGGNGACNGNLEAVAAALRCRTADYTQNRG